MKTIVAIACAVLALTQAAAAQTITKRMVASDTLRASAPTLRTTTSTVGGPVKQFYLPYGGVVRLSWKFRSDGVNTATVLVHLVLSLPTSCGGSTQSAQFVSQSCDFEVPAGSHIQIYLTSSNGQAVSIRNARLSFDLVDVTRPALVIFD
jgi:hypothetical protein